MDPEEVNDGDLSIEDVCNMLISNSALHFLSFWNCFPDATPLPFQEALQFNTSITTFDVYRSAVTDDIFEMLLEALQGPNLLSFHANQNPITQVDVLAERILEFPRITQLILDNCQISARSQAVLFTNLSAHTSLTELKIYANSQLHSTEHFEALAQMICYNTTLQFLEMDCPSSVDVANAFASNVSLTEIAFRSKIPIPVIKFLPPFCKSVQAHPKLYTLRLNECVHLPTDVLENVLELCQANSGIGRLELEGCKLNAEAISPLKDFLLTNSSLTTLKLAHSLSPIAMLWDDILDAAAQNHTLTHFTHALFDVQKSMALLHQNSILHHISFRGCPLSLPVFTDLCQIITHNTSINMLGLEDTSLTESHWAKLADIWPSNTTLTGLNVAYNPMGDSAPLFLTAVAQSRSLESLILTRCQIQDESADSIAHLLTSGPPLIRLNLTSNLIGLAGLLLICDALKHNALLRTIHLGYNTFGKEGMLMMESVLATNTVLEFLYLSSNQLSIFFALIRNQVRNQSLAGKCTYPALWTYDHAY